MGSWSFVEPDLQLVFGQYGWKVKRALCRTTALMSKRLAQLKAFMEHSLWIAA